METSLHRQLKEVYSGTKGQTEVTLGDYRIDVVLPGQLVEIQHGSLAAINRKIERLLQQKHEVLVVKPIVAKRRLIKLNKKDGKVVDQRWSPKRGTLLDIFDELIYFTRVFPHPRLSLEFPLVEIEEFRYPGHGRRRRWRKRDHVVEDQRLVSVHERHRFRSAKDMANLLPKSLPRPFDTADIASAMAIDRWIAQRMTYCLRHFGSICEVGKKGNAIQYEIRGRRAA